MKNPPARHIRGGGRYRNRQVLYNAACLSLFVKIIATSMSRMLLRLVFSRTWSLASLRKRATQEEFLSVTRLRGSSTKPRLAMGCLTASCRIPCCAAASVGLGPL